jgi:hypothetical protein
MALKVKMDGNSRLAKQFRFHDAAVALADRIERGEVRCYRTGYRVARSAKRLDPLGHTLKAVGFTSFSNWSFPDDVLATYLGVTVDRLPNSVLQALQTLKDDSESMYLRSSTRTKCVALGLRILAKKVKNARIGLKR